MARSYRAAIVGCGAIAGRNDAGRAGRASASPLSHAGAYRASSATTLVAAADVDEIRLKQFGQDWGVNSLYADYRELLQKEKIDILSICTPTHLHAGMIQEACKQGVAAIFCEKPLASSPAEARAAIEACLGSGTVLAVNYFRRWNTTLEDLAGRLADGTMGQIRRVNAYYTKGIVGNGTHAVDLILWLVGRIKSVQALRSLRTHGDDIAVDALCLTETDVPCYLQACEQGDFNILELDLLTDRGRIRLAQNGRRLERYIVKEDPHYRQYAILDAEPEVTPTAWQDCLSCAVEDLTGCLATGAAPKCGGREAYDVLTVAAAILASARGAGQETVIEADRDAPPLAVGVPRSDREPQSQ